MIKRMRQMASGKGMMEQMAEQLLPMAEPLLEAVQFFRDDLLSGVNLRLRRDAFQFIESRHRQPRKFAHVGG